MALQDVCGFQEIAPCSTWNLCISSDTTLGVFPAAGTKPTWRKQLERDDGPLHLLLPPLPESWPSCGSASVPRPFSLSHGTTTLGFTFQGGVIAAADTRASAGGLIACPVAQKVIPIHSHLVVTTSGSGADCMLWERILAREMRLYQLRHRRRLSVTAAAKLLSAMLHPFKGTEVCVAATLCGWDVKELDSVRRNERDVDLSTLLEGDTGGGTSSARSGPVSCVPASQDDGISSGTPSQDQISPGLQGSAGRGSGPRVCYVCSDGLVLKGELISVGSGSPYAYAVLDDGWRWRMSVDEAVTLAREAVYRATHRDAYSGNNVDLFHITERGWSRRHREDLKEEYHREKRREEERRREAERRRREGRRRGGGSIGEGEEGGEEGGGGRRGGGSTGGEKGGGGSRGGGKEEGVKERGGVGEEERRGG